MKQQTNFTPGPWEVGGDSERGGASDHIYCDNELGSSVAVILTSWPISKSESRANARLMAVAPEMYEELRRQFVSQNCTCKLLNYVGEVPPCGKCKLGLLLDKAVKPC